jgi:hypothetical protein
VESGANTMSVSLLLGVPGKIKKVATDTARIIADVGTLLSRLTAARAAKLDNIAVAPKCFILDVHTSSKKDYYIPLGYTAKTFSKVSVISHVFGHKSTGEMYPAIAALTSTRNNILIATPLPGQNLYFYGMVTIIDFNP